MKLSKLNRVTHRDVGYLIAGLTLIYAISGIALNHKHDWNTSYRVEQEEISTDLEFIKGADNEANVKTILEQVGEADNYKSYYFPAGGKITIFIKDGALQINTLTGNGYIEKLIKRPVFYQINYLHYNPGKWWKIFSDIYCVALLLVTITGLFIVKGRNGITKRGAILTVIGVILPLLFLFIY